MDRLFKRSNYAKVFYLNGMWDFVTDPAGEGKEKKWYEAFPENSRKLVVPSCWNTEIDLFRYTGTAWYRTKFESAATHLYLKFESVSNECDVWLDGKHIGYHYGGFLEFGFEVDGLTPGEHELILSVDNKTNNVNTYPLTQVDWYNYGGISRQVEVREIGEAWIRDYRIGYDLSEDYRDAKLHIRATVKTSAAKNDAFEVYIGDEKVYSEVVAIDGEKEITLPDIDVNGVKLWGIFQPNLYFVRLKYGNEDIIERIGFREIKAVHKEILLNGEKIRILGVNRHEEHPDWGFSVPFKLIKKDIDIIRNMNCNAIRTSHYPNSKKTADYCDEIGMLFWEELPLWGRPEEAMTDPLAVERVLAMEKEMIERDIHHPSIIIWSMHNECATDTEGGYQLTEKMSKLARSMDPTRLITHVSNHSGDAHKDICYDLDDVVCMNKYLAWYESTEYEDWTAFIERLKTHIAACESLDKPFMMTEFGAGAIPGVNTFEAQRWTEDYQSDALAAMLEELWSNPYISGTYIWQYCDIRTAASFELARPRSFNNKGLVDEYRRPKRAYRTVQKIYGDLQGKDARHDKARIFGYNK